MLGYLRKPQVLWSPLENGPKIYKSKSINKYTLKEKRLWPCLNMEEQCTRKKDQDLEHSLRRTLGIEMHCSDSDTA